MTAFTSSEAKRKETLELGAHQIITSRDADEIMAAARQFDPIISTVNVKLDWNAYVETLKPKGRLHYAGLISKPLDLAVFPLPIGQRFISSSPVGSPTNIARMLDFAVRHDIKPVIENFRMDQVNDAMARLRSGQVCYRTVLSR